jgi:hypothetical protein
MGMPTLDIATNIGMAPWPIIPMPPWPIMPIMGMPWGCCPIMYIMGIIWADGMAAGCSAGIVADGVVFAASG